MLLSVQYFTYRVHFLKCFGSFVIAHERQLCRALGFWVNSGKDNKTFDVWASCDKVTLFIPLPLTFTQIFVHGLIDNWITFLFPPYFTLSRSSETVGFEARHKEEIGITWLGTRSGSSKLHQNAFAWPPFMFINWIWGDKTIILGGPRVFGPQRNNSEFEGTKG